MRAILGDIHGNLEALDAVMADYARHRATEVYCLGDLVGYGPNPVECVELSRDWDLVLKGNFDQVLDPEDEMDGWSAYEAANSVLWSRRLLPPASPGYEFLATRPHAHTDGDFLFVHATPSNPLHEYLFPEDILNPRKMERIFALIDRYCFCGHTHIPGVYVENAPGDWGYFAPDEINNVWRLDGRKTIVNVGSVGQPRDGDWRACYVLLDGPDVAFRRVEYDVETTVRKIHAIPDLADFLGDRLREGR